MLEVGFVILFFLIRELTISILNCRSFWYFIIKNVFRKIKINYNLKWRECCLLTWESLQIQCTSRFGNRVIDQWSKCNRRNEILCSLRLNDCHVGPMAVEPTWQSPNCRGTGSGTDQPHEEEKKDKIGHIFSVTWIPFKLSSYYFNIYRLWSC